MTWVKGNHYTAFFIEFTGGLRGFYNRFRTRFCSVVNVTDTKFEMNIHSFLIKCRHSQTVLYGIKISA